MVLVTNILLIMGLIRLERDGTKIVATNDTHYLEQKDANAHEAFMCIAMNKLYDVIQIG